MKIVFSHPVPTLQDLIWDTNKIRIKKIGTQIKKNSISKEQLLKDLLKFLKKLKDTDTL